MAERVKKARLEAPLTEQELAARTPRQRGPLTQLELSRRANVSRELINKIENDSYQVGSKVAARLALALGREPGYFMETKADREALASEVRQLGERLERVESLVQKLLADPRFH